MDPPFLLEPFWDSRTAMAKWSFVCKVSSFKYQPRWRNPNSIIWRSLVRNTLLAPSNVKAAKFGSIAATFGKRFAAPNLFKSLKWIFPDTKRDPHCQVYFSSQWCFILLQFIPGYVHSTYIYFVRVFVLLDLFLVSGLKPHFQAPPLRSPLILGPIFFIILVVHSLFPSKKKQASKTASSLQKKVHRPTMSCRRLKKPRERKRDATSPYCNNNKKNKSKNENDENVQPPFFSFRSMFNPFFSPFFKPSLLARLPLLTPSSFIFVHLPLWTSGIAV